MTRVVVVGAGVGGLTTAAVLARAGLDVIVLESHAYPGGCASTFERGGYRFDAGATLAAGFYPGGPMHQVAQAAGIGQWSARPIDPAMVVYLPDGSAVRRWTGEARWDERRAAFGLGAERFWQWQEHTAAALWDLALRSPPWPPQTPAQATRLVRLGVSWLLDDLPARLSLRLAADVCRPVAAHLRGASERLRRFVDAQLLISAQTTSPYANALYGASALDMPRRGVVHLKGGIGTIAQTLLGAVRQNGGQAHLRREAVRILIEEGRPVAVETADGASIPADVIVANLPPWNMARLLGDDAPRRLRRLPPRPQKGWGAFMLYLGVDGAAVPSDFPLHHQVVAGEPLGNGNAVFLSLSPAWDETRAPPGTRAITASVHTDLDLWWDLYQRDRDGYEALKRDTTGRVLSVAERALPGLREAAHVVLPGTPVTYERFTRRAWGWVGGFPQTSLFQTWGPRLATGLWMVGDSIFPGQSTAAVALGGLRVAQELLSTAFAQPMRSQELPRHLDARADEPG